jgi:hypothetical protein
MPFQNTRIYNQYTTVLYSGPNIAESFLPKNFGDIGEFGNIGTFGDMGTEIKDYKK